MARCGLRTRYPVLLVVSAEGRDALSICVGDAADMKGARQVAEKAGFGDLDVWFEPAPVEGGGRYVIGVERPGWFEKSRSIA